MSLITIRSIHSSALSVRRLSRRLERLVKSHLAGGRERTDRDIVSVRIPE